MLFAGVHLSRTFNAGRLSQAFMIHHRVSIAEGTRLGWYDVLSLIGAGATIGRGLKDTTSASNAMSR